MFKYELSIVIPVYCSKDIIGTTVTEIEETVGEWSSGYEIILVNDGSRDGTYDVIMEMAKMSDHIKAYNLSKNFGQHNAIIAGLNFASGRKIVIMDDDGQHDPKYIKRMIEELDAGYDAVFTKYEHKFYSRLKNLGSHLNDAMAVALLNKPKGFYLSPFKAITEELKDACIGYHGPYPYIDGLILTLTQHITAISAVHRDTKKASSTYSLKKLISLWLNMFTNFSVKPLRIVFIIGFAIGILSLGAMFGYSIVWVLYPEFAPRGWTMLFLGIVLFGALQLVSLGLIGEYVGRILLMLNNRPQYFVKDESDKKE